jgi:glycosyltransferase involved in cell wall biosynthesis
MSVDVIIPCYNAARYVGAALDSVLAQDADFGRVIVVDDGSTDDSVQVVRTFGPPVELAVVPHAGIAATRNAGIRLSSAEFIAFVDADDLWTAGSLAIRLARLRAREDMDGVFAALENFASPDIPAERLSTLQFDTTPTVARFAGTLLIRRAAFLRAGFFDESLQVGEMIDWVARAAQVGLQLEALGDVVMRRRIHDMNTTQLVQRSRSEYLRAVKMALASKRAAPGKTS